jgi:hypothetical protein
MGRKCLHGPLTRSASMEHVGFRAAQPSKVVNFMTSRGHGYGYCVNCCRRPSAAARPTGSLGQEASSPSGKPLVATRVRPSFLTSARREGDHAPPWKSLKCRPPPGAFPEHVCLTPRIFSGVRRPKGRVAGTRASTQRREGLWTGVRSCTFSARSPWPSC